MKRIGRFEAYTLDECLDMHLGEKGTTRRDEHERSVEAALDAYRVGEAVRSIRKQRNLTQEELGKRIGVNKAQISKLERGASITLSTMSRVFKALGAASATLDLGGDMGKVALW
ncbi:MAG: helix-turn-helix domain-containing protein [Prevotellaceae bacterium]|nr:helix-turn-helix domain-containing protein [Prevotellaceae bacterium]